MFIVEYRGCVLLGVMICMYKGHRKTMAAKATKAARLGYNWSPCCRVATSSSSGGEDKALPGTNWRLIGGTMTARGPTLKKVSFLHCKWLFWSNCLCPCALQWHLTDSSMSATSTVFPFSA